MVRSTGSHWLACLPTQIEDPSCFQLATHFGLDTPPPNNGYQTTETTPGIGAQ
jgi:hypothetical protein